MSLFENDLIRKRESEISCFLALQKTVWEYSDEKLMLLLQCNSRKFSYFFEMEKDCLAFVAAKLEHLTALNQVNFQAYCFYCAKVLRSNIMPSPIFSGVHKVVAQENIFFCMREMIIAFGEKI